MKFDVIVIDPPWNFKDALTMSNTKRSAQTNYDTLSFEDIKNLNIKSLSSPDGAILCLWVPSALLDLGLECMKSYGFNFKQTYVWVKCKKRKNLSKIFEKLFTQNFNFDDFFENINSYLTSFGMGRLMRASHEIALIGISDKNIYKKLKNKSQRSVCFNENLKHSQKPNDLYKSLELMFPESKYLDVFSRDQKNNWVCVGKESPMTLGEDIKKSIKKLQNLSDDDLDSINKLIRNYSLSNQNQLFDLWNSN